jgi:hypothetical protein
MDDRGFYDGILEYYNHFPPPFCTGTQHYLLFTRIDGFGAALEALGRQYRISSCRKSKNRVTDSILTIWDLNISRQNLPTMLD